ncbi:hypothetical protein MNBD_GAMMA04-1717 [hydrothermal vent metagenome]|uniref:Uncharacterized protein n=1 Tax=hydrothermal vent metagenome TaxID=652676 RepID=A0A3B0W8W2_9ZZZZ
MGVDNVAYIRPIVFACSILFVSSCGAGVDTESKEVLDHLSKNILKATTSYGDRIGYCDKLVTSNDVPKLDREKLSSLNATRENILTAVAFLKFNNYFLCERDERLELTFYLETMESLKRELQVDPSSVEKLQSIISYPSRKELELELDYLKLPEPQRKYFESIIGNKPFDLMKVLELNKLMRE